MQKKWKEMVVESEKRTREASLKSILKKNKYPDQKYILVVQASSAGKEGGNFAKIHLNGFQVNMAVNKQGHYRGLHIVVVNPRSGLVVHAAVFDTYQLSFYMELFIYKYLDYYRDDIFGHIVIAACMDDCTKELSEVVTEWFETMGSKLITNIGYRHGFVFIGIHGNDK